MPVNILIVASNDETTRRRATALGQLTKQVIACFPCAVARGVAQYYQHNVVVVAYAADVTEDEKAKEAADLKKRGIFGTPMRTLPPAGDPSFVPTVEKLRDGW